MNEIPGLTYKSPNRFTLSQCVVLAIVPPVAACVYGALAASGKKVVRDAHILPDVVQTHGRAIVGFWHESLALAACQFKNTGYHTLTSYSFDGEIAARTVRCFGLMALRGSTSRGGLRALKNMEGALDAGVCLGFTLDGPRGPRRVAQPGVAILSARTGVPVVPAAFAVDRAWRLHSWDRFPIPKPGSRIIIALGEPIPAPPGRAAREIEEMRQRVEQSLNALHRQIEDELGVPPVG